MIMIFYSRFLRILKQGLFFGARRDLTTTGHSSFTRGPTPYSYFSGTEEFAND
jgi:hypothetical protein